MTEEPMMTRMIAVFALALVASPALALERSPTDRGHVGADGGGDQSTSARGDRGGGGHSDPDGGDTSAREMRGRGR